MPQDSIEWKATAVYFVMYESRQTTRKPLGGNYRNSYQERHLRGIVYFVMYESRQTTRKPLGGNYRNSYQERHLRGIKIWSNYDRANDRAT